MNFSDNGDRAISPVVGTVLLVAIVLVLSTVGAGMFFSLTDETDPRPTVVLGGEQTESAQHELRHRSGETLDGDRLEFQGVADSEAAAGETLSSGDSLLVYPTAEEIQIVWYGDNDESYVLTTVSVEDTLPEPDENCGWVDAETNGGTDEITIDNEVVNCDIETDGQVKIRNGGVVIGDVVSDLKELDGDNAEVYGDVTVEAVLNLQDGRITGSATSRTADVKLGNATVERSVEAEKVAEVTDGSTVQGDVESNTKDSKVLGDSVVEGSVTADGIVKVQDSEIQGDVYIDPADFDCTNATIGGQDCGSYTPKDPNKW
ncbi:polymer-forming cytoskeletal protein [Haloarcula montana]|uniref:polymer-forming cytoskeletal protein n=1 Tax=Haloarcula montana TaxID=3111776 RepID=UPI002D79BABA|nr:polymer-forming cytoskeletal protein [Haloarcula sp. GH36]